jgi:hypothetical protein
MMIKLDVKGRVYASCGACGSRLFVRSRLALRGLEVLWGPLAPKLRANDAAVGRELLAEAGRRAEAGLVPIPTVEATTNAAG